MTTVGTEFVLWMALAGFVPGVSGSPANARAAGPSAVPALGPRIRFAEPVFDFGRIKSGEIIEHAYRFTNVGDEVLEVTSVRPACGCMAAGNWSRRVKPGQSGSISIEFNSAHYGGAVLKTITVESTDRSQPALLLQLKGTVWRPVEVVPTFAVINIPPDAGTGAAVVNITNHTAEHLAIAGPVHCSTAALAVVVRTNQPGKAFQLDIRAVPPLAPGNLQGQVTLKTTSTNLPVVSVNVWVVVQPALAVLPPQVTLPPAPLAARTLPTVVIQSHSTNRFSLTEPSVGLPGVKLALRETIPGRAYEVTLAFPAGFTLPSGSPAALTFKTSLAQFPSVTVPIAHLPKRPAVRTPRPPSAGLQPPMPPPGRQPGTPPANP
ncbi:MAG: DUF1573 domain-containing protein [Verrucomicrobia bacterium]|nr:DUF1573 domain-containing protein [Verrucomicrobiota bacterium]